ncbi:hypothetical protein GF371_01795 [Candidatus Woesearchaeota archaeon]|nr:hypothetical protein [Candidatus Woesearchaeota archaeon]
MIRGDTMEIVLEGKIKGKPKLIEGFPGLGLVGTIATEFLIEQLKAKPIGSITGSEIPPLVAVHDNKLVKPIGLFYAEKQNLLILHVISGIPGAENKIADLLVQKIKQWNVSEIISVESVAAPLLKKETKEGKGYYYCNNASCKKKMKALGLDELKEGIIMGVTGALMLKAKKLPLTCIFAETHTKLPDSKAAAKIIEVLNGYLDLKIDVKPLLKSAEEFEHKIKNLIQKATQASKTKDKKKLSYVG